MGLKDCVVIGAGIIGATIAKSLGTQGRDVLLIDANYKAAGTRPSGGHIRPSWLGGMKKEDYEPALEMLQSTWGLIEEQFSVWPAKINTTVYRVDTDLVLQTPHVNGLVSEIKQWAGGPPSVVYLDRATNQTESVQAKMVVVAAGNWCADLIPGLKIAGKAGVSFRFKAKINQGFIKPWAPYKQIVAHQQSPNEVWIGDGTAIIHDNWTEDRQKACLARCKNALGRAAMEVESPIPEVRYGIRPYCKIDGPCLFEQIGKHIYVVTGAGKLGTIAAGYAANRIINA